MVTIFKLRAPGMTFLRMPMLTWTVLTQSVLILFSFPVVTAGLALLWIDRNFGASFFDPAGGGDPILYQHIFWYFGHPEVYILILPLMGAISEVIPVFSRKPLFGYKAFIFATLTIAALGTAVWAHHMFTTGAVQVRFFAASSMLISVPTGVKMFNWIATMWKGKIRFTTAMMFAVGFLMMFLIGGITGVFNGTGAIDFAVHDTYYVVGHFHYVLVSAALFAIFAGWYYWYPKITGRLLSEKLGKWQFWVMFVGVNLTFFPMHIVGLDGMPRRIQTYANEAWSSWNMAATIGSYLIGIGILLFFVNALMSRRRGDLAGDDPWGANTLEWATTSPPPYYNFDKLPPIRSERPVFDLKHPEYADAHAGAGASAGAASTSERV
jgi:cytochrome c oxidase subunit 1